MLLQECRGRKVVKERKLLEVHIEKGMRHNQKITFHGEVKIASKEATRGMDSCVDSHGGTPIPSLRA